jgi:hypothetical protein
LQKIKTKLSWSALLATANDQSDQPPKHFFEDFTAEELLDLEKNYYHYQQQEEIQFYSNLEQI